MDLDDVDAVLELVLLADGLGRQLALLADRHEAAAQAIRDGAAKDEAARLDAGDDSMRRSVKGATSRSMQARKPLAWPSSVVMSRNMMPGFG